MLVKRLFLATFVTALTLSLQAQGGTLTYCLPSSKICLRVTTTHTTYTPGEFCAYAERYLRLNQVQPAATDVWELTSISLNVYGEADPQQLHTFSLKNNTPYIELTSQGVIKAVNTGITSADQAERQLPATARPVIHTDKLPSHDYLTEEILMAGSVAKMAELAAKEIYSIRESRNNISRGLAEYIPADGESIRYVLDLLERQERALLQLFTGYTTVEERVYELNLQPHTCKKETIARFSTKFGLVDKENLVGEPLFLDLAGTDAPNTPPSAGTGRQTKTEPAFYYIIPGRATVSVYDNRRSYISANINLTQFGTVEGISPSLFSRGTRPIIVFDTDLGAITSMEIPSK